MHASSVSHRFVDSGARGSASQSARQPATTASGGGVAVAEERRTRGCSILRNSAAATHVVEPMDPNYGPRQATNERRATTNTARDFDGDEDPLVKSEMGWYSACATRTRLRSPSARVWSRRCALLRVERSIGDIDVALPCAAAQQKVLFEDSSRLGLRCRRLSARTPQHQKNANGARRQFQKLPPSGRPTRRSNRVAGH